MKRLPLLVLLILLLAATGCSREKRRTSCHDGEVTMSVSAYSLSGKTASGAQTMPGTCACGPGYPFGTRFEIPKLGVFTCRDRGSEISDDRLDIWMPSETLAKRFGRKTLKVRVHCP
jgi:3D (Asp-Asp-Asp) domain-containing protein